MQVKQMYQKTFEMISHHENHFSGIVDEIMGVVEIVESPINKYRRTSMKVFALYYPKYREYLLQ